MSVTEHHAASTADQRRWEAVLERDPGQDGKFVYGVASTHIYCRPSCPSRRPAQRRRVRPTLLELECLEDGLVVLILVLEHHLVDVPIPQQRIS